MEEKRKRGRPKGSPNKASALRAARAESTGLMPCDVMLEAMRHFRALAARHSEKGPRPDEKKSLQYLREAASIAKDCAQYFHSKMQTTTLQANPDKPMVHKLIVEFVKPLVTVTT